MVNAIAHPFLRQRPSLTQHAVGLPCGLWVVDGALGQAYKVSVITVPGARVMGMGQNCTHAREGILYVSQAVDVGRVHTPRRVLVAQRRQRPR